MQICPCEAALAALTKEKYLNTNFNWTKLNIPKNYTPKRFGWPIHTVDIRTVVFFRRQSIYTVPFRSSVSLHNTVSVVSQFTQYRFGRQSVYTVPFRSSVSLHTTCSVDRTCMDFGITNTEYKSPSLDRQRNKDQTIKYRRWRVNTFSQTNQKCSQREIVYVVNFDKSQTM